MPELNLREERTRAYGRDEADREWSKFERAVADLAGVDFARKAHALVAVRDRLVKLSREIEHLKGQRTGGLKSALFYREFRRKHPTIGRKRDLVEAQRWLVQTRKTRAATYQEIASLKAREALMLRDI